MAYGVEKTTIKGILDWYINQNVPSYTITEKLKWVKGGYPGSNLDEGIEKLEADLNSLCKDGNYINANNYELQLFPAANAKSKKTPLSYAIKFNFSGEATPNIAGQPGFYNTNALTEDRLLRILDERDKQKELQEIEDEIEEAEPQSFLAGIGQQLLSDPQVQTALATTIINLPGYLAGMFGQKKVTSLAGIKKDKNLDEIIQTLFSKGVKIEHLQKLSEMDEAKIKMLISML